MAKGRGKYNIDPTQGTSKGRALSQQALDKLQYDAYLRGTEGRAPKTEQQLRIEQALDEQIAAIETQETGEMSDTQRVIYPVPEGQSAEALYNPGGITQIPRGQGMHKYKDGTTMSASDILIAAEHQKARAGTPLRQTDVIAAGITPADYYDLEGIQQQTVPGLGGIGAEQNRTQMRFNRGLHANYETNVDPELEPNNLINMMSTPKDKLGQFAANVPHLYQREIPDPVAYETKFNNIQKWSEEFADNFNRLFSDDFRLARPADMAAIQEMLVRNNMSPRTLTELMYSKITDAHQIMEGNVPHGLAGAMLLSVLEHYADAQIATDRRIRDLDVYPRSQAELDSWSKNDRDAFRNLEREMFNEELAGQKSIGYKIAQAGQMRMTGDEEAILGEVAKRVMIDTFGDSMFVQIPTVLGARTTLSRNMVDFVTKDRNLFMFLLNAPHKLPRVGEEGRIPLKETIVDVRRKGIPDPIREWADNKDISGEAALKLHALALHTLNDTPHTPMQQARYAALFLGYNTQTGEFSNNDLTHEFDHKEFKNIKYKGEVGNRTKEVEKYDVHTDAMKALRDFSDTEKDNLAALNLKSAIGYIGQQIRFDHFIGSNVRYYHEANVLNPQSHSARAFLGAGAYIDYKTGSADDMMLLKSGIMTMVGGTVPGAPSLKFDKVRFERRAEFFDKNIDEWVHKYGDLVEDLIQLENVNTPPAHEIGLIRALQDPSNPFTQAGRALLQESQSLEGYYTFNAIIEAVKLQLAIEKGDKVYMSNFVFETDGISNGLSSNALASAEEEVLAMTGLTSFVLDQTTGYNYPDQYDEQGNLITDTSSLNVLTKPTPPQRITQSILARLERNSSHPAKVNLLRVGTKSGLISDSTSKGQLTPAMYGSGDVSGEAIIRETYMAAINEDPSIEEELLDPNDGGYATRDEIIRDLAQVNWGALVSVTGNLRNYNAIQQEFITEIVKQYEASAQPDGTHKLPKPQSVLDSGFIMRHGEPVSHIHGAELSLPARLPGTDSTTLRQMTNVIDPLGQKRSPTTGELVPWYGSITGAPVKMTHSADAYMVQNYALRAANENPGAEYGITGGILLQMYDGFFGPPKSARWMDKTLNEEFFNLGWKVNNITALISNARKEGYDLSGPAINETMTRMNTLQADGREVMKDSNWAINQFPLFTGVRAVGFKENKKTKLITEVDFDYESLVTYPIRAKHKKTAGKPRRIYGPPPVTPEEEAAIIDKAKRIKTAKEKNAKKVNPKRVEKFTSRVPIFRINDIVYHRQHGRVSIQQAYNADRLNMTEGSSPISYYVKSDAGKNYMVNQDDLKHEPFTPNRS